MGQGHGRRSAQITLPADATSPARARRFVGSTLAAWRVEGGDDALLVVSELVTNALLHARTAMTVHLVEDGPGELRLSVSDGSVAEPRERRFGVESGTGRGLRLLGSVSLEWGVDRRAHGKSVWCRLPLGGGTYAAFDVDAVDAL